MRVFGAEMSPERRPSSRDPTTSGVQRVLVYRLGSIGDFVVALPALHLIRRSFPAADIRVLTSQPVDRREMPARSVLDGTGLVDDYLAYPVGTRSLRELRTIRNSVRAFVPDLFVYLAASRGLLATYRDYVFFRSCGVRTSIGYPFALELRNPVFDAERRLFESEAMRLSRRVIRLGDARPSEAANWDLHLSDAEFTEADAASHDAFCGSGIDHRTIVALSIGTKQAINDWGDDNWRSVLRAVGRRDRGLILIGATAERDRSELLGREWAGPVANLCGRSSPRGSAAAIRRARLFLGHDSGPMHLAAAVGTQCVVVFSKKNLPGQWFPFGNHHRVFYPPAEATSIRAIQPEEVVVAVESILRSADRVVSAEPA